MLSSADVPTIKHAIYKRLRPEPHVHACEVQVSKKPDHIAVGVVCQVWADGHLLVTTSAFDLPPLFELSHLHNEIDEAAEQIKAARKDHLGRLDGSQASAVRDPRRILLGTGLRGRWKRYVAL